MKKGENYGFDGEFEFLNEEDPLEVDDEYEE